MKNLAAKFVIALILVSALSTLTLATTRTAGYDRIVKYFTVPPYGDTNRVLSVYAGQTVYIKVTGDGSSDLDMYVSDDYGDLIVKDVRKTTDGYVTFKVPETGDYHIEIENTGRAYNSFKYEVNIF